MKKVFYWNGGNCSIIYNKGIPIHAPINSGVIPNIVTMSLYANTLYAL